jgi:hypothetical protein
MNVEEKLRRLALFCTLRGDSTRASAINTLSAAKPLLFIPSYVAECDPADIGSEFAEVDIECPLEGAMDWKNNCRVIANGYGDAWSQLLITANCNADMLTEHLSYKQFNELDEWYVFGIHAYITELSNINWVDMPDDERLYAQSRMLFGEDTFDDECDRIWKKYEQDYNINRAHVFCELRTLDSLDEYIEQITES